VSDRWQLRSVHPDLAERYFKEGWWTDTTLGRIVADGLQSKAARTFGVHSKVRPWRSSIADVDAAARRFAGSLRARGIGPGDVVLFQLPNWVEAAITFWATAYVGATIVPVVHFYGPKEVDYILRVTEPDIVVTADRFASQDYLASYETLLADRAPTWLVVGDTPAGALPKAATAFADQLGGDPVTEPAAVDPDLPAIIGFTSGTTRDPKGVIHSHRTMSFEARQLSALTNRGGPPPITGAPVGHFIGMLNALVCSMFRPDPINLIDVWDPGELIRLMREEGLGLSGGSTYFLLSVLDHPDFRPSDVASMPFAGLGGSPVPLAVSERAERLGITVFRSYGSTEHPSITGSYMDEPKEKRITTDGHPLEGIEMRLDDQGEIYSRGPDLFMGYTDPALTASVFDADGWYRTGDVGIVDADGYLSITDRVSDVIIRGGENISAQEVEELLLGLDSIAEVAVVAAPDERFGEHAAAIVRLHDGASVPTLDDVRTHLAAAGLAKQKWPAAIHAVGEFPRTPSGKVKKFVLRKQLREGGFGTDTG
jgi:acyl-CoA synthetase (AMP-forming)/AMP-acid ligase II